MKIKKIFRDVLLTLRDDLLRKDGEALESHIQEVGLETLFDPEFLRFARIMDVRPIIILVATLGVENSEQTVAFARLLAVYQCIQKQLTVEQAVDNCIEQGWGAPDFYKEFLTRLMLPDAKVPYAFQTQAEADDLLFAIELALDVQKAECVAPLLQQWMKLDKTDKPWLKTCRLIAERTEMVVMRHVAAGLANALDDCLRLAPARQQAVLAEMYAELANLRVIAKQGEAVLHATKQFEKHASGQRALYMKLRGLMLTQQLPQAIEVAERLMIDLLRNPPEPSKHEEESQKYTFQVEPAERTLQVVNQALRAKGLKPFLMSGTLLGYERNRGILPHDKDVDMGIIGWENQFVAAQALVELGHFHVHMADLRRDKLFLLAPKDTLNEVAIDLFFFHDKGDHFLHGIDFDNGYTQNFKFSKFGLQEVDFLGQTFCIPDNTDVNLSENYGDWHTPQPSYVVTVESPAIVDKGGDAHRLSAHLEVIKTLTNFMSAQRARRLLAYQDESGIALYSKPAVRALEHWLMTQTP